MRFSSSLQQARLLRRYKRFLADVITGEGELLCIHCPNTGTMKNCLNPGGPLWFSLASSPRRKLPGTWELALTPQGRLACINTARANALVEEALLAGDIPELVGFTRLRREVPYGSAHNSRIDFLLDYPQGPAYVEVKSVTLGFADSKVAAFPDAVTCRGLKHLRELTLLAEQGIRAVLLYCVNLTDVDAVRPADEIDPAYGQALRRAMASGVQVLAVGVHISLSQLRINRPLAVVVDY